MEEKLGGHKQISFRSFKKYSVDEFETFLGKVIFPNYKRTIMRISYKEAFFQKFNEVINGIASLKTVRINKATSEWFDKDVVEILSIRNKSFKKFESSHLNIDSKIYKETTKHSNKTDVARFGSLFLR